MADDDDMMEMDELGDDEEGEESGGGGNPLMKYLPLIGVMLVVNVILAYFVAQWFFVPDTLPEDVEGIEEVMADEAPAEGAEGEGGDGYVPPPPEVAVLYTTLETIVVNPKGTEGLRFLSATVHLGLSSQGVADHIDNANLQSRINDTLIRIFTSKTIADVDPSRHDLLKDEIITALNAFLGNNAVLEVYFQGFVLQ